MKSGVMKHVTLFTKTPIQVFFANFAKNFKKNFITEHLRATASG